MPTLCFTLQVNREALQKRELERQADMRAKQQELAIALQVSLPILAASMALQHHMHAIVCPVQCAVVFLLAADYT